MIYKDFQGEKLSSLGFGTMRLPVTDGKSENIDVALTEKMIAYAMEQGVNYYDTAWGYHEGNSELVIGEILSKYPRDSFYLADKFPGYDLGNMDKVEEIFEKQLEKCKVDYFDFYLFHNLCEMNIEQYLDPKYGIYDYLIAQKKAGRIKHLGVSNHGSTECLKRFLEAYGKDIEFCQLQLNWFDWEFQDSKAKAELLNEYNIPIWVMEPLRGGKLAKLDPEYEARLLAVRPYETVPAWSFRFLQTVPGVTVVLSGMSDFDQVKANIETCSVEKPLCSVASSALLGIAADIRAKNFIPCTSCRYCTSHCPQGLDIPYLISLYNEQTSTPPDARFIAPMAMSAVPKDKRPRACVACRSCEAVCPQQIKISEVFADFRNIMKNA